MLAAGVPYIGEKAHSFVLCKRMQTTSDVVGGFLCFLPLLVSVKFLLTGADSGN